LTYDAPQQQSPFVTFARRVEETPALDGLAQLFRPGSAFIQADRARADALQGKWLGHALHPIMTFVPLGAWTSATILDLVGGPSSRTAAQRLVATGILGALPTALTGLAEFGQLSQRDRRTASLHAVSNQVALGLFVASYRSRRRGSHGRGAALGLVAHVATGLGGFLGGHLTEARKVSSAHPAFDEPADGATADVPSAQQFTPSPEHLPPA
jgi:uncharacterized membrane protein